MPGALEAGGRDGGDWGLVAAMCAVSRWNLVIRREVVCLPVPGALGRRNGREQGVGVRSGGVSGSKRKYWQYRSHVTLTGAGHPLGVGGRGTARRAGGREGDMRADKCGRGAGLKSTVAGTADRLAGAGGPGAVGGREGGDRGWFRAGQVRDGSWSLKVRRTLCKQGVG